MNQSIVRPALLLLCLLPAACVVELPAYDPAELGAIDTAHAVLRLANEDETLFVFRTNLPFQVEAGATWMEVSGPTLAGPSLGEHTAFAVKGHPGGLEEGQYTSFVALTVEVDGQREALRLPVVLDVGEARALRLPDLASASRLTGDHPALRVLASQTLGGHTLLEVLDARLLPSAPEGGLVGPGEARQALDAAGYPIVMPFMALEFLGMSLADDTGDVEPNLDAVNTVSYERYRISSAGEFTRILTNGNELSDAKPWADQSGLGAWPMLIGYSGDTPVLRMFQNKDAIAQAAVAEALAYGYEGYVLDVEGSADATKRGRYLAFIQTLGDALHAAGLKLMVAQARWSTIAPAADLNNLPVDFVGSMDPMHSGWQTMWQNKLPPTYHDVDAAKLVWIFSWDFFRGASGANEQRAQIDWMEQQGLNDGIAGAGVFRTPATPSTRYNHQIDYYQEFRDHYPAAGEGRCLSVVGASGPTLIDDDDGCAVRTCPDGGDTFAEVAAGHDGEAFTFPTGGGAAACDATWNLRLATSGSYTVEIYLGGDDPAAEAEVVVEHDGISDSLVINPGAFTGWLSLGVFSFAAGGGQSVRLQASPDGAQGQLLADAVRLERIDNGSGGDDFAGCYSGTLGRDVGHGECVQVTYQACGESSCGWYRCHDGGWTCSELDLCDRATHEHAACAPSSCYSSTLGRTVSHGDSVQVAYAGCGEASCGWYSCHDGSWACGNDEGGEDNPHAACAPTDPCPAHAHREGDVCVCDAGYEDDGAGGCAAIPPPLDGCYSSTLGRSVDSETCVQVAYPGCGHSACGWYRCHDGAWGCVDDPAAACADDDTFEHTACQLPEPCPANMHREDDICVCDDGFVDDGNGACEEPTPPPPNPDLCPRVRISGLGGGALNIRTEPNTDHAAIGQIFEGSQATVLEEAEGQDVGGVTLWYRIEYGPYDGWVTAFYAECLWDWTPPPAGSCGEGDVPTGWTWPVPSSSYIVQPFGNPIQYQTCGFHTGLDVSGAEGAELVSMAEGKVVHVGPMWYSGSGVGRGPYAIIIQHAPGLYSTYGHNSAAYVEVGDCVTMGQPIGAVGNLGYSFGPHLHLEMVTGTSFTGNWQQPFLQACSHYDDPLDYATP